MTTEQLEAIEIHHRKANDARVAAGKVGDQARRLAKEAARLDREAVEAERLLEAFTDPKLARFVVAEGKTLNTKSGLLPSFHEVRLQDLDGGLAELEHLVADGSVAPRARGVVGAQA
jgi:hypothetical protein